MGQFNACNHLYATDAAIRAALLKKGELSLEEAELLYSYADMYCNAWTTVQIAFDEDLVDESIFRATLSDAAVVIDRWPNMKPAIERWFGNYPDLSGSKFLKIVNARIRK
jgi:hypothetical protein